MANLVRLNRENQILRLERHMRVICPECGKENSTRQDWRRHLNVAHNYATKTVKDFNFKEINDKFHECQICLKLVSNAHQIPTVLQYHHFLHCPFPLTYQCTHCLAAFNKKKGLCEHLKKYHCTVMDQIDRERKLQDRSPKYNNEFFMKYLCPLCDKMFDRYNIWQQHVDAAHSATSVDLRMFRIQSTKNYYCAQCSHTLFDGPTKAELQRHNFTHQPYPLYFQCSYCSLRKNYKTELLLHFVKTHKNEFEKFRDYIKKPSEWGGQADEEVVRELDTLLEKNELTQTDILQKAIQNSLIDLEEEIDKDQIFNHEFALDQSLQELDDILNTEIDPNLQLKGNKNPTVYEFGDAELEELCSEMFEEITEACSNDSEEDLTEPNRKRLKLDVTGPENLFKMTDSMQKEMQKYIHFLCPECGQEFLSQSIWRAHVFEVHNLANAVETKFRSFNSQKTSYICLVCYQVQRTAKQSELRRHHFQHMPYHAYLKCAICSKTKSSKPKILQHLQLEHLKEIQKSITSPKAMVKNFRCLDCDKLYAQQTRYEAHCRQCPQRLKPLAVGLYDIEKNMKLLEHLKSASRRIVKLCTEEGLDASSIKPPYK